MTDNELIEGRNLIEHPDFTGGWRDFWTVTGSHLELQDSATGKYYLQMVEGATASCSIDLPIRPGNDAVYWFSLLYEGMGTKANNVRIQKEGGEVIFDEPFLTRKVQESADVADPAPLADFRAYPPTDLKALVQTDKRIDLRVTAADGSDRNGINVTGVKIDLRLAPLELSSLSLDGREIPLGVLSPQAVS